MLRFLRFAAVSLVTLALLGIPLATWIYVQLSLTRAEATVLEKSQQVYRGYSGNWKLYLRLRVGYQPRDTQAAEASTIDVDEVTWDQSKPGSRLEISYVPVPLLRQIPLLYTRALATPLAPAAPAPDAQRSGSAIIRNVTHVNRVAASSRSRGVPAWQPFDVIELSFVPEGRSEAVTAVDSVDAGSVPNLVIGNQIAIDYSTARPRAAKISAGTRACEWKNNLEVFGPVAGFACLALVLSMGRRRR